MARGGWGGEREGGRDVGGRRREERIRVCKEGGPRSCDALSFPSLPSLLPGSLFSRQKSLNEHISLLIELNITLEPWGFSLVDIDSIPTMKGVH